MINETLINEAITKPISFGVNSTVSNSSLFITESRPIMYATDTFIQYAKDQCYAFLQEVEMSKLYIVLSSAFFLFMHQLFRKYPDFFKKNLEMTDNTYYKVLNGCNDMGFYILVIFLIYELWFI